VQRPNDPLAHTEPSDVERSLNLLLSRLVSMQMKRRGPTEVSHDPIAKIFRDVAVEAGDRCGRRAMVLAYGLAPFLGIKLRRDPG